MSDPNYLAGPFVADVRGGYVFVRDLMFAQVRGWGQLQRGKDAEVTQDAHLKFMVDALNEKVHRDRLMREFTHSLNGTPVSLATKTKLENFIDRCVAEDADAKVIR